MNGVAVLSCQGDTTSFSFGDETIRFRTSPMLDRYTSVRQWDEGYLVVGALYRGIESEVEEYLDLVPILSNLYRDPTAFCRPIKEVLVER